MDMSRVAALALAGLLCAGCLLDIAPALYPLDEMWNTRMLDQRYGHWKSGQELGIVSYGERFGEQFRSSPALASTTRHGIRVVDTSPIGSGWWEISGGLLGRDQVDARTIELFGKERVRIHGPFYTARMGRDYSYEFFLVVRVQDAAKGRIVREWKFAPDELALRVPPELEDFYARGSFSEGEKERMRAMNTGHFVSATLTVDTHKKAATVTIMGLKRPFVEQVDLSKDL